MTLKKEEAAEGCNPGDLKSTTELAGPSNPTVESEQELSPQDPGFDWQNDPSVILRDQAGVAAFHNRFDELVIVQRDTLGSPGVIYVAPQNIDQFLKGLDARARPAPPKRLGVLEGGE
jgi:hypothetical protein